MEAPFGVVVGPAVISLLNGEAAGSLTFFYPLLIRLARSRYVGQADEPRSCLIQLLKQPAQCRGGRLGNDPTEQMLEVRKEGVIPICHWRCGRHFGTNTAGHLHSVIQRSALARTGGWETKGRERGVWKANSLWYTLSARQLKVQGRVTADVKAPASCT